VSRKDHPLQGDNQPATGTAHDVNMQETPVLPLATTLIPQDTNSRSQMKVRAEELARVQEDRGEVNLQQFLRFRLGPVEWYGIPYPWLDEILYASGIVTIPGTPPFIAGVINLRGELLTLINLKHFFHTQSCEPSNEARILVVCGKGLRVGLLVDAVAGNENYNPVDLAPPIASEGVVKLDYVHGIHQGVVTMLDLGSILADSDLTVNTSV